MSSWDNPPFVNVVSIGFSEGLRLIARGENNYVIGANVPASPRIPAAVQKDGAAPYAPSAGELVAAKADIMDADRRALFGTDRH
jgi:hypothetical protein